MEIIQIIGCVFFCWFFVYGVVSAYSDFYLSRRKYQNILSFIVSKGGAKNKEDARQQMARGLVRIDKIKVFDPKLKVSTKCVWESVPEDEVLRWDAEKIKQANRYL